MGAGPSSEARDTGLLTIAFWGNEGNEVLLQAPDERINALMQTISEREAPYQLPHRGEGSVGSLLSLPVPLLDRAETPQEVRLNFAMLRGYRRCPVRDAEVVVLMVNPYDLESVRSIGPYFNEQRRYNHVENPLVVVAVTKLPDTWLGGHILKENQEADYRLRVNQIKAVLERVKAAHDDPVFPELLFELDLHHPVAESSGLARMVRILSTKCCQPSYPYRAQLLVQPERFFPRGQVPGDFQALAVYFDVQGLCMTVQSPREAAQERLRLEVERAREEAERALEATREAERARKEVARAERDVPYLRVEDWLDAHYKRSDSYPTWHSDPAYAWLVCPVNAVCIMREPVLADGFEMDHSSFDAIRLSTNKHPMTGLTLTGRCQPNYSLRSRIDAWLTAKLQEIDVAEAASTADLEVDDGTDLDGEAVPPDATAAAQGDSTDPLSPAELRTQRLRIFDRPQAVESPVGPETTPTVAEYQAGPNSRN